MQDCEKAMAGKKLMLFYDSYDNECQCSIARATVSILQTLVATLSCTSAASPA